MRRNEKCVSIICDECEKRFVDSATGDTLFLSADVADEIATEDGWHVEYDRKDKHYCLECYLKIEAG